VFSEFVREFSSICVQTLRVSRLGVEFRAFCKARTQPGYLCCPYGIDTGRRCGTPQYLIDLIGVIPTFSPMVLCSAFAGGCHQRGILCTTSQPRHVVPVSDLDRRQIVFAFVKAGRSRPLPGMEQSSFVLLNSLGSLPMATGLFEVHSSRSFQYEKLFA